MQKCLSSLFPTLVVVMFINLSVGLGAPSTLPQELPETPEELPDTTPYDQKKLDSVIVTIPREHSAKIEESKKLEYYFPFRTSMSPRGGAIYDTKKYSEKSELLYLLGFNFMFTLSNLDSYEAGAETVSNGTGNLHLSRFQYLTRTRVRPFYKYGGGVNADPHDGMVAFVKLENYSLRGTGGIEFLLATPMSVRFETELVVSTKSQQLTASLGYSWAW